MNRAPRLLWVTLNCLIDHTSGASLSAREMLRQLVGRGYEVEVLGATIFEAGEGPKHVRTEFEKIEKPGSLIKLPDGLLQHTLVKTASPRMEDMRVYELDKLASLYLNRLKIWQPDVVWLYGGRTFELLALSDAKRMGAATVFLLVNGTYRGTRWHRDVDLILTDSQATAELYRRREDIHPQAIGQFIRKEAVVADHHDRRHVTFVTPKPEKGAYLVAQIAMALEERRPDIVFEIVESRGAWTDVLRHVSAKMGKPRETLTNVVVTPNTTDMRPIYSRARVVLAPSLWWESGTRVLVEAMLNGIPAIVTNRGGPPETIGDGGIAISLPKAFHKPPYTRLLPGEPLDAVLKMIERLYDDEVGYQSMVQKAVNVGQSLHDIDRNTDRLLAQLASLLPKGLGTI